MNKELAKTLTTALVQFIDKERTEGTMCCSNEECESLEYHIRNNHFDDVEAFIQKKLSGLTEFETHLKWLIENGGSGIEHVKVGAKELFDIAKKELARRSEVITLDNLSPYDKGFQDGKAEAMADLERAVSCGNVDNIPKWLIEELDKAFKKGQESSHEDYIRGYINGHKDAEKQHNAPSFIPYSPLYQSRPLCWEPGGTCTNPQMDCINCPRRTTGGGFNTASGTSTANLHGNTSTTDGKEHNPSFTD